MSGSATALPLRPGEASVRTHPANSAGVRPVQSPAAQRPGDCFAPKAIAVLVGSNSRGARYSFVPIGEAVRGGERGSAHRFLHERADLCLFGGGQLLQREGDRPHGAFVEVRILVEAERQVPLLELLRVAEEADDLAVP